MLRFVLLLAGCGAFFMPRRATEVISGDKNGALKCPVQAMD